MQFGDWSSDVCSSDLAKKTLAVIDLSNGHEPIDVGADDISTSLVGPATSPTLPRPTFRDPNHPTPSILALNPIPSIAAASVTAPTSQPAPSSCKSMSTVPLASSVSFSSPSTSLSTGLSAALTTAPASSPPSTTEAHSAANLSMTPLMQHPGVRSINPL